MNQSTIIRICTLASLASIVIGFVLLLAALSPKRTSQWGEVAMGCTPQAILVAGGILGLAVCSLSRRD